MTEAIDWTKPIRWKKSKETELKLLGDLPDGKKVIAYKYTYLSDWNVYPARPSDFKDFENIPPPPIHIKGFVNVYERSDKTRWLGQGVHDVPTNPFDHQCIGYITVDCDVTSYGDK